MADRKKAKGVWITVRGHHILIDPSKKGKTASTVSPLHKLKKDTEYFIKKSKEYYAKHPEVENEGEWLDQSIIPHIERLSKSKEFEVTGSCSGHDGFPFISLVFADHASRDKHMKALMDIPGMMKHKSEEARMEYFPSNHPGLKIEEEWTFSTKSRKKFWKNVVETLMEESQ